MQRYRCAQAPSVGTIVRTVVHTKRPMTNGSRVPSLNKLAAKDRVNRKIGFLVGDGSLDAVAIFEQEKVTQKWGDSALTKSSFAKRSPKIFCAADCFFGTVVDVISDGLASL